MRAGAQDLGDCLRRPRVGKGVAGAQGRTMAAEKIRRLKEVDHTRAVSSAQDAGWKASPSLCESWSASPSPAVARPGPLSALGAGSGLPVPSPASGSRPATGRLSGRRQAYSHRPPSAPRGHWAAARQPGALLPSEQGPHPATPRAAGGGRAGAGSPDDQLRVFGHRPTSFTGSHSYWRAR